jgi:hypothetical protein
MILIINKSKIVTNKNCVVCITSVNLDENSEDDYIEYTLLLHCKWKTKKTPE